MKIELNDVTAKTKLTTFGDLEEGDYFTQNQTTIWKKTDDFCIALFGNKEKSVRNAIQITNNDNYLTYGLFPSDVTVEKLEIVSIDYRRIKE